MTTSGDYWVTGDTEHGMTRAELAGKVGYSDTTIRGIITEKRNRFGEPSRKALLDMLGVSQEDWYSDGK